MRKPHITQAIAQRRQDLIDRLEISTEHVLRELASIAFANLSDVLDWDEDGNIKLRAAKDIHPAALSALQSIRWKTTFNKDGEVTVDRRVTMHNKLRALEVLLERLDTGDGGEDTVLAQFMAAISGVPIEKLLKKRSKMLKTGRSLDDIVKEEAE